MILNQVKKLRGEWLPAEKHNIYEFHLRGHRIRFDADTLAVELLMEGRAPARPHPQHKSGEAGDSPLPSGEGQGEGRKIEPDGVIYWPRPERPNHRLPAKPGKVKKLVLNVTHDCNLACRYCFAAGHERARAMTAETARKAIEFAFGDYPSPQSSPGGRGSNRRRNYPLPSGEGKGEGTISVSFFGGEPLMNWPVVLEAIRFAEVLASNRGAKAKFHITTNASLLNAEMLGELKGRDCSFLVSIDGPQDIHDAWRPFRLEGRAPARPHPQHKSGEAGEGSYATALAALELLHRWGMSRRVSARATYPLADSRLIERLDHLYDLQRQGLIQGFSLEPAFMSEGCAKDSGEVDWDAHAAEYHDVAEWYVKNLEGCAPARPHPKHKLGEAGEPPLPPGEGQGEGVKPGYFYFIKLLNRLRKRQLSPSECGAGCGYMTVGPDGTIYACHRETGTEIGRVDYGIDESRRAAWMDNRYYARQGCPTCWARNVCGGGCRQQSVSDGKPITQPTAERCRLMKTLIKECLWIMAEKTAEDQRPEVGNGNEKTEGRIHRCEPGRTPADPLPTY